MSEELTEFLESLCTELDSSGDPVMLKLSEAIERAKKIYEQSYEDGPDGEEGWGYE